MKDLIWTIIQLYLVVAASMGLFIGLYILWLFRKELKKDKEQESS